MIDTRPERPLQWRSKGPVRLDRLAKTCLGPAISRYGFGSAEIIAAWPEIVGPDLGRRTQPERVRWPRRRNEAAAEPATLVVRAEGGDAIEVQHLAPQIIERVNAFFGWGAIGRVALHQAPVATRAPASRSGGGDREARDGPPLAATSRIEDPELRAAFDRLGRYVNGGPDKST